jgi:hypothetical protein
VGDLVGVDEVDSADAAELAKRPPGREDLIGLIGVHDALSLEVTSHHCFDHCRENAKRDVAADALLSCRDHCANVKRLQGEDSFVRGREVRSREGIPEDEWFPPPDGTERSPRPLRRRRHKVGDGEEHVA